MTRYFEIHVTGRNGFSAFVETDAELPRVFEDAILEAAVKAKVIEGADAKDVVGGAGYVQECSLDDLKRDEIKTEQIHAI